MSLLPVKILEYEEGVIRVTLNAMLVAEIKAIVDKYPKDHEPYLAYVYLMTALDSPFANIPMENDERSDSVIYEVNQTIGPFDPEDPLLKEAVEKVSSLTDTPMVLLAKELEEEIHRIRTTLKNTPITMGGDDDNFKIRMMLLEKIEKISGSYQNIKKKAEEELQTKLRGNAELGEY